MQLIRKFHGGADEKGFLLVHVEINGKAPKMVESIESIFYGMQIQNNLTTAAGLEQLLTFFRKIEFSLLNMWKVCNPKNFL